MALPVLVGIGTFRSWVRDTLPRPTVPNGYTAGETPASPQWMATALPGHGTLWKVAHVVKVPPGATATSSPGSWLQFVVSAATLPSSPLPPDMYSTTYPGEAHGPGQPRSSVPPETLV